MIKSFVYLICNFNFISHKGCTIWLENNNMRLWGFFFRGAIFKNYIKIAYLIMRYQWPCDITSYGSCHDATSFVHSKNFP